MDLSPFCVNPCGYAGMEMAKISDKPEATTNNIAPAFLLENILALLTNT